MRKIDKIIGLNIKGRREALELSQAELGNLAGKITGHTVGLWEAGKQPIRRKNLEAVAKALNCSQDDLYKIEEKPKPSTKYLLGAIAELEKENEELREANKNLSLIPELWIKRLLDKQDHVAMLARGLLSEDYSEAEETKLAILKAQALLNRKRK